MSSVIPLQRRLGRSFAALALLLGAAALPTHQAGAFLPPPFPLGVGGRLLVHHGDIPGTTDAVISGWNLADGTSMFSSLSGLTAGRGIAYDPTDGNTWISGLTRDMSGNLQGGDGLIYKLSPTGSVVRTIPDPSGTGANSGIGAMDFDPEERVLWVAKYYPDDVSGVAKCRFYKLNPTTGAVLHDFYFPFQGGGGGNDTVCIGYYGAQKVLYTDSGDRPNYTSAPDLYVLDPVTGAEITRFSTVAVSGIDYHAPSRQLIGSTGNEVVNLGAAPFSGTSPVMPVNPGVAGSAEDISLAGCHITCAPGRVQRSESQVYLPITVSDSCGSVASIALNSTSYNIRLESPLGVVVPTVGSTQVLNVHPPTTSTIVYAVKIDSSKRARAELKITDVGGGVHFCDPVIANLKLPSKRGFLIKTYKRLPESDRYVSIENGTPGVTAAYVQVNGRAAGTMRLTDGELKTLDVQRWMRPGEKNTIRVTVSGSPNATAILQIGDAPPSEGETPVAPAGSAGRRMNRDFGNGG